MGPRVLTIQRDVVQQHFADLKEGALLEEVLRACVTVSFPPSRLRGGVVARTRLLGGLLVGRVGRLLVASIHHAGACGGHVLRIGGWGARRVGGGGGQRDGAPGAVGYALLQAVEEGVVVGADGAFDYCESELEN